MAHLTNPTNRPERFACPACGASLRLPAAPTKGRSACPKCKAVIDLPVGCSPAMPASDYAVGGRDQPSESLEVFLVVCQTCQARLHPRVDQVGTKIICPDCHVAMIVPPPPSPTAPVAPWVEEHGEFDVGAAPPRPEVDRSHQVPREPVTTPPTVIDVPRLWFLRGVLTFPFTPEPLIRLLGIAAGLALFGTILAVPAMMAESVGLPGGFFIGMFVVDALVLLVPTMMFSAACYLAIIPETATGAASVEAWPEVSIGDWAGPAMLLLYFAGLSLAAAGAAQSPLAATIGYGIVPWAVFVGVGLFVFHLLVLAGFEAESPMFPYDERMFQSVLHLWHAWLVTWVMSILVWGACIAAIALAASAAWLLGVLVESLLIPTAIFIDARLVGRLAWRIGEWDAARQRRRKKKKKKRVAPAEAAESGEAPR